jgi:hypothetical protein
MVKRIAMAAVLVALLFGLTAVAKADTVVGITTRIGNDTADWGQLGGDGAFIGSPFSASTLGGIGITGTLATCCGQERLQGTDWGGNFTAGDNLIWTAGNGGSGPLTLAFSQGVSSAGAQIQADFFGGFTAQICDNFGDCFSEAGNSNSNGDGSAIFIGLQDNTGANITSITFSLLSCVNACGDFAINTLSVTSGGGGGGTPEPASLMLLGTGLLGLAGGIRKRMKA